MNMYMAVRDSDLSSSTFPLCLRRMPPRTKWAAIVIPLLHQLVQKKSPNPMAPAYAARRRAMHALNINLGPSNTLKVLTPAFLSPKMSGKSLKRAITTEKRTMNAVPNAREFVHWKSSCITLTVMCEKNPSCTITALTARMHIAARNGNLFHLRKGKSAE